jgi:hypothetical protein
MTRLVVAFSLLFLRRLRIIEVVQGSFNRKMTRQELGPSEVQIREQVTTPDKTVEKEYRFLLCSRQVPLDSHSCLDKRRAHCRRTVLTLAFPREREDGRPAPLQEGADIFAFLPVRRLGIGFLVQADWILVASREELDESAWNDRLRDEIPAAFLEVVRGHFLVDPLLSRHYFAYLWYSLDLSRSFFGKAIKGIFSSLRSERCILGERGEMCMPKHIVLPSIV